MRTRTCNGATCRARIFLGRTLEGGKWIPFDIGGDPKGQWFLLRDGLTVRRATAEDPLGARFTPHWVTCPDAPAFRGSR